jgi:2-polyprenyl-3-methyl-5-hydroxy-6-metoxy-1,4-benzoquinol methylase
MKNIINRFDLIEVLQEIIYRGPKWILRRLRLSESARVSSAWDDKAELRVWPNKLVEYTNKKITGNEKEGPVSYFTKKYLASRDSVTALSLGCGDGVHELEWAKTGNLTRLDAFDLSVQRIEMARRRASEAGLEDILKFEVRDFLKDERKNKTYDLVIVTGSLHHFSPLDRSVERISEYLNPNGLLYVSEFIGPRKMQWTETQIARANQVLKQIPRAYRKRKNGFHISRVWKPGLLRMYISDPSEAIESDQIVPMLDKYLKRVEFKPLGGTITHLVFAKIAHNFQDQDDKSTDIINMSISIEETLIEQQKIDSDFLFAVYKKS